jgi:hypothetical protein
VRNDFVFPGKAGRQHLALGRQRELAVKDTVAAG